MVRGDERFAVKFEKFGDNSGCAFIHRLHSFDSRLYDARVADHIGIREVQDDQIVVRHARKHFIGDFKCAYFSVSAMRNCDLPAALTISPRMWASSSGAKINGEE